MEKTDLSQKELQELTESLTDYLETYLSFEDYNSLIKLSNGFVCGYLTATNKRLHSWQHSIIINARDGVIGKAFIL